MAMQAGSTHSLHPYKEQTSVDTDMDIPHGISMQCYVWLSVAGMDIQAITLLKPESTRMCIAINTINY
eukprot:3124644-Lingulodinium_polyedra.AAC.1